MLGPPSGWEVLAAGSHPGEITPRVTTDHTAMPEGGDMPPSTAYEILIRGHASERVLARLNDDFSIERAPGQHTRLIGEIRDAAHLHGVITQLTALAIEIVSLTPVEPERPSLQPTHPPERQQ